MITAVIIEDEERSKEVLLKLLKKITSDVVVLDQASSVEEGYQIIKSTPPQLVFLDIEMIDGNGFNLLEKFESIEFEIIFITAYDQYAIQAFKYSALDYLLKPIDIEELDNAVSRAKKSIDLKKNSISGQIKALLDNIKQENNNKKVVVKSASKIDFISINDIIYCGAEGAYTKIVVNNRNITASKPLKYFDIMFKDEPGFFRASKSCLINLHYVKSYKKDKEKIEMENGIEVEVSRRRKKEFLTLFEGKVQI